MSKTIAYIYGKRKPGVKDESVISPERMKEIQATAAKYVPKKRVMWKVKTIEIPLQSERFVAFWI